MAPEMSNGTTTPASGPGGSVCELRIWHSRYKEDGTRELVEAKSLDSDNQSSKDHLHALEVTQKFNKKEEIESTKLRVNSPHLLKVFREVVQSYPEVINDFEEPIKLEDPYTMLLHYWEDLGQYRQAAKDGDERQHLDLLFDFMESNVKANKDQCDSMIKSGRVNFDLLWTVYRPGALQYASSSGHPVLYRLSTTAYEENEDDGKWLEVHCAYTDHDGTMIGKAKKTFKIHQRKFFAGGKLTDVTELPVYPRSFVGGRENLEHELAERGGRFVELLGIHVKGYNGMASYLKEPPDNFYDYRMGCAASIYLPYTVRWLHPGVGTNS